MTCTDEIIGKHSVQRTTSPRSNRGFIPRAGEISPVVMSCRAPLPGTDVTSADVDAEAVLQAWAGQAASVELAATNESDGNPSRKASRSGLADWRREAPAGTAQDASGRTSSLTCRS